MKRIVICADGTWNSPEQGEPTNILQIARGIRPVDATGIEQVVFYDWGLGTDRKRISGGISGDGIDKNIMDGYRFLVHNHEPGDAIFLFGFSRGAYTVRSLAGFIRNCGLLRREHADRIPEAYRLYRKRNRNTGPDAPLARDFRARYAVADITPIEFLGAFDTVGALGIPLPFWGTLGEAEFLFHDTEPSRIIRHARHAVSIDENRQDFEPTLWSDKPGLDLRQAWFAGVHADIGGGYRERGLSNCALRWMLDEARACGLVFEDHLEQAARPDPLDRMHNERKGIFRMRPPVVRSIEGEVHPTALERWQQDEAYRKRSKALDIWVEKTR
ncbi:MAG: DUF2235 domain-containing protein [Gammaproteobacteria bacterium]|nr:MAG: DUF2235 domain-containing protein [Gammaproteobacteria bacterium]